MHAGRYDVRYSYRALERVGLRPTSARLAVLGFFLEHPEAHVSAERLFSLICDGPEPVSMATLYRSLGQLQEGGLISSFSLNGGRSIYELNRGTAHDHRVCTKCGRIDELFDSGIDLRVAQIAAAADFSVAERQLVLLGVCRECKAAGVGQG